jgi:hypothetical protein
LLCPANVKSRVAIDFTRGLTGSNISYCVGFDAAPYQPQTILSGDDNLILNGKRFQSRILNPPASNLPSWTSERHQGAGNIFLTDVSVQPASSVESTSMARLATHRLAIPSAFLFWRPAPEFYIFPACLRRLKRKSRRPPGN